MIGEWIAALFAAFVVDPVEADIRQRLEAMQAPVQVVAQVGTCLRTTGPMLVDRASGDLWWAATTAMSVATGLTSPAELLDADNPACAPIAGYLISAEADA
ncbi:hypothetical protein QWE_07651 [Agrobacterium albertimagni AOL15]|uniref:Uncharacterized protein n=1 Tax=Agrobacterium albertimagni AOL15 TaxID=1156935 RepID=K2Q452_9HYPH|nr:hypothetical protein [Agrobacterium albertimagni]EKF59955.1 hypothetical protein QWE_07651 [Agrobacterium albertimagni AOL15]